MENILLILAVLAFYFLPLCIAIRRRHANATPIILVNLLFGWTVIGWFVCLIWSTTSNILPLISQADNQQAKG